MPWIWRIPIILLLVAAGVSIWLIFVDDSQDIVPSGNNFVTSPDIELDGLKNAHIVVTFRSNMPEDLAFSGSPTFQLWSGSGDNSYNFIQRDDVTINQEPSGAVSPGGTFSYDLLIKLNDVEPNQWGGHIVMRPLDNRHGTLGPNRASVVSSEVTFTED